MKNLILCLTLIFPLSGCALLCGVPEEARTTAKENAELSDSFITFMDAGQTSREQEQRFIRACRRAWHAQNYALNDVPLPHDVDVWQKQQKLGMNPTGTTGTTGTSSNKAAPKPIKPRGR